MQEITLNDDTYIMDSSIIMLKDNSLDIIRVLFHISEQSSDFFNIYPIIHTARQAKEKEVCDRVFTSPENVISDDYYSSGNEKPCITIIEDGQKLMGSTKFDVISIIGMYRNVNHVGAVPLWFTRGAINYQNDAFILSMLVKLDGIHSEQLKNLDIDLTKAASAPPSISNIVKKVNNG